MSKRRRSRRSYLVESVLVIAVIALIFAFYSFGWYEPIGSWLADQFSP